jgi:peptidyl-prolyl cis-trans isomerase A (cyclophilin A)
MKCALVAVVALLGAMVIPAGAQAQDPKAVRVLIETEAGEIEAEIDTVRAPITAANFLKYVDGGLFDGGRFFRTVRPDNQVDKPVKIAVIQAAASRDKRAEFFPAIPLERTSVTGLTHKDGTLSMARAAPDTARDSFSICVGDQPALDFGGPRQPDGQGFAAFGRVIRGMDVVRKIQMGAAEGETLTPPVAILRIRSQS